MSKPLIRILNSSSFGKHFPDHLATLQSFAEIKRTDVPADISAKELFPLISDANGIIASVTPKLSRQVLENCPKLVALFRHGIGCDNVDLEAATELGIRVSRVQGYVERDAVAEQAIALLMSAARFVPQGSAAVKSSAWSSRASMIGIEIKGKRIGIVGLGNIGSRSAEILSRGFNAEVIAYDPHISAEKFKLHGAKSVSFEELLKTSSAILLHCPRNSSTERMFSSKAFEQLKKGTILVNTCRGELLVEDDLVEALNCGQVGCYATDVVEGEPINSEHRLAKHKNVIVTPHLGGYSWESLHGMGQTGVDDMLGIFTKDNQPKELANPDVLKREYRKWP